MFSRKFFKNLLWFILLLFDIGRGKEQHCFTSLYHNFMGSCTVSCTWLFAIKLLLCHGCSSMLDSGFLKQKTFFCVYWDQHETGLWLRCLSLQVYVMPGLRKCLIKLRTLSSLLGLARSELASDSGWPQLSDLCIFYSVSISICKVGMWMSQQP